MAISFPLTISYTALFLFSVQLFSSCLLQIENVHSYELIFILYHPPSKTAVSSSSLLLTVCYVSPSMFLHPTSLVFNNKWYQGSSPWLGDCSHFKRVGTCTPLLNRHARTHTQHKIHTLSHTWKYLLDFWKIHSSQRSLSSALTAASFFALVVPRALCRCNQPSRPPDVWERLHFRKLQHLRVVSTYSDSKLYFNYTVLCVYYFSKPRF